MEGLCRNYIMNGPNMPGLKGHDLVKESSKNPIISYFWHIFRDFPRYSLPPFTGNVPLAKR